MPMSIRSPAYSTTKSPLLNVFTAYEEEGKREFQERLIPTLIPRPLFSMGATSIPCLESSVMESDSPMVSSSSLMSSALGFLSLLRMGKYSVTL